FFFFFKKKKKKTTTNGMGRRYLVTMSVTNEQQCDMSGSQSATKHYSITAKTSHNTSIHEFKSNFGINQPSFIEIHPHHDHNVIVAVFTTLQKAEIGLQLLTLGKVECQPHIETSTKMVEKRTLVEDGIQADRLVENKPNDKEKEKEKENEKAEVEAFPRLTSFDQGISSNESMPLDVRAEACFVNDANKIDDVQEHTKPTLGVILSNQPIPDDIAAERISTHDPLVKKNLSHFHSAFQKIDRRNHF
ncbi:hypothetical protein RFI_21891, partial [Reticulomyxa filosa]